MAHVGSLFFLIADSRRWGTRIGRRSFLLWGRALLRGSGPRPASRRPDRRGLTALRITVGLGNLRVGNLRKSGRCVRRPWSRSASPHASAQDKRSVPDLRAPSAEIRDQKIRDWRGNFFGRMRGGIGSRPYMATGIGSLVFFVGRRFSQIGNADRAQIFFIVGSRSFTRIGTSACFAAAGSARIVGTENTTGMY